MFVFKQRTIPFQIEGYPDWMASLLHARGVQTKEEADAFLSPAIDQLHDPMLFPDMAKAVKLIKDAAQKKQRAIIYGDYDVDGICASTILYETLRGMGLKTINYIPDRHTEGYGLNMDAIEKLAAQADLLISVDCGITSIEEVAAAKKLNMTVIITDHHTLPDTLPPADAVLSPLIKGYPFPYLCGAGVAWKLSLALKGLEFARRQLDLAALATMADMVPLKEENRVIAWLGIRMMSNTGRPGLMALKAVAGIPEGKGMTSDQMVFQLAPRLNAGGRLSTATDALELLKSQHREQAEELAAQLDTLNARRKQEERAVIDQADRQIVGDMLYRRRSLVVVGEDWNSGVVGLAAGRLAEKYRYPTVALTRSGNTLVGSGRSAGDVNLYQALKRCEDLFVRFGGHPKAAGLTMQEDRVEEFKERFDAAVKEQLQKGDILPEYEYDAELPFDMVTIEMIKQLDALSPFGVGNPPPVLLAGGVSALRQDAVGGEGKHLKLTLQDKTGLLNGIAFSLGHLAGTLNGEVDVLFRPQINSFLGKENAEGLVQQIRPGKNCFAHDPTAEKLLILQELKSALSEQSASPKELPDWDGALSGTRGTLFLCRTHQTASQLRKLYPEIDAVQGKADDARAFHTIALRVPIRAIQAPYQTVVLADGLINPKEAALVRSVLPNAKIALCPRSSALDQYLREMALTLDEMRAVYIALMKRTGISMDGIQYEAALSVLEELHLIKRTPGGPELLPMHKCDPAESALFKALANG